MSRIGRRVALVAASAALAWCAAAGPGAAQPADRSFAEALRNVSTLVRPGRIGYATVRDGNKFVQCRRLPDGGTRCEAAGSAMQPSLRRVLTEERIARLAALGWTLDPSFGNRTRTFAADMPLEDMAALAIRTLLDGYGARSTDLELSTTWAADVPCPPRAGLSQNLAGSVSARPRPPGPAAPRAASSDADQARRSETSIVSMMGSTQARRRAGLGSFPGTPPAKSTCPA